MMRYLLFGALATLLLILYPPLGPAALAVIAAVLSEPLAVAFGFGLAVGIRLRGWRWTR
ncbi:hypothetical protein ABZ869_01505 [Streptomyces sp. NPDC046928]|uniref:hypothetical protein n=1 Tax=Streptomyces sp. NPDC046928 TaxID=3155021 RepID=UPI0033E4E2D6